MKKKLMSLLLVLALGISLTACGPAPSETTADETTPPPEAATRMFTDSMGREVEVPAQIDQIAISGPATQIVLFALCPDKLVGIATDWSPESEVYLDTEYYHLPVIGQLYGGKGELNLETLLASGAQVVIDVGEPKSGIAEDLDALQEQTGIPFVHITSTTATAGDAYRMLGGLLNMEEEAERLAAYCDSIYAQTLELAGSVEKVDALYITGEEGHNVIAQSSYHSEVMDLLTNNLAVLEEPSSKGSGNEVDMEQILTWNPGVIVFGDGSVYADVADDPAWQSITAVQNGDYYEVPFGPYNWMGFPPSVQRYLGMLWLGKVLYPEETADYDLYEEVREYYGMFYHCDLTREQYDVLMTNSLG